MPAIGVMTFEEVTGLSETVEESCTAVDTVLAEQFTIKFGCDTHQSTSWAVVLARPTGLEPVTLGLEDPCSTPTELRAELL